MTASPNGIIRDTALKRFMHGFIFSCFAANDYLNNIAYYSQFQ
jgi:hypothetical protein